MFLLQKNNNPLPTDPTTVIKSSIQIERKKNYAKKRLLQFLLATSILKRRLKQAVVGNLIVVWIFIDLI